MKCIVLVAVLLSLVFAASAQPSDSQQCTSFPGVWSSRVLIGILDDDECITTAYNAYYFYNYQDEFTRIDISLSSGGISIYNDYENQDAYIYDRSTSTCLAGNLEGDLFDPTLPSNVIFQGTVQIGTETIESFSIPSYDSTGEVDLSLAQDGCSLVSVTTYNYTTGAVNLVETFYDFFPDVPDNTFTLPIECQSIAEASTAHHDAILKLQNNLSKRQLFNRRRV